MDERDLPLYRLEPTTRFSDRAGDYVRSRPDYPAAAIDRALAGLATPERRWIADVGAGTGISARLLAARGARVIAVEPNAAMRAAAAPDPRVRWIAAVAESLPLAGASLARIVCAQAFHWFDPARAGPEFRRALSPDGRLVVMWNFRNETDPFTRAYSEAIREALEGHPAERMGFDPAALEPWFSPPRLTVFAHAQALDRDGLHGRASSASYVPKQGPGAAALARRLDAAYDAHRDAWGRVTLRYRTEVWIADPA
jgi:SAM-dependent methyltransferase